MTMPDDPKKKLERLRRQLKNGERGGDDEDRQAILEYMRESGRMHQTTGGPQNRYTYAVHLVRLSERVGGVADLLGDKDTARQMVDYINDNHEGETNAKYRCAIRKYGKVMTDGEYDDMPDSIAWIPGGKRDGAPEPPDEEEMLRMDEARAMANAAKNHRDAAMVMVQLEAGLRPFELYDLTISGFRPQGDGFAKLRVQGKTGTRNIHIYTSVPYIQRWLRDHPDPDEDGGDTPMWTKLDRAEKLSYGFFPPQFKTLKERADIPDARAVTPQKIRGASFTWLLVEVGLGYATACQRQGRNPTSKSNQRYLALLDDDTRRLDYGKNLGVDMDDDVDDDPSFKDSTISCPNCNQSTDGEQDRCLFCQAPLGGEYGASQAQVEELQQQVDILEEQLTGLRESMGKGIREELANQMKGLNDD